MVLFRQIRLIPVLGGVLVSDLSRRVGVSVVLNAPLAPGGCSWLECLLSTTRSTIVHSSAGD
jgi:hypothetical protein